MPEMTADPTIAPFYFEARLSRRYIERGFEPTVAEAISITENYFLDPMALLPEIHARQAEGSNESPPFPIRPDFQNVDLFVLSDVNLRAEILFLSAALDGPNPLPIPVVLASRLDDPNDPDDEDDPTKFDFS